MRTTIDRAGRIVVPKAIREELGLRPGIELELRADDGRLVVAIPSRLRVEQGPRGVRFAADGGDDTLDSEQVRAILERSRR